MTSSAPPSFDDLVAPFRRELLAHCYRITGSLADAEDALQEAFVRAWKALPAFEGRSSLRRWLYTICTRTSVDLIGARKRSLASFDTAPGDATQPMPAPVLDPVWLEPAPSAVLDDAGDAIAVDDAPTPEQRLAARESVRLAFLSALQRLPAKQRAALILRDVAGYSAEETADILELSLPATNSALQRAREVTQDPAARPARVDVDAGARDTLGRFVRAFEAGDADALASLLKRDVVYSMPPFPLWIQGVDAVRDLYTHVVFPPGPCKLLETRANGAPAFGVYQNGAPLALMVVDDVGAEIGAVHAFLSEDPRLSFARFGLPASL